MADPEAPLHARPKAPLHPGEPTHLTESATAMLAALVASGRPRRLQHPGDPSRVALGELLFFGLARRTSGDEESSVVMASPAGIERVFAGLEAAA